MNALMLHNLKLLGKGCVVLPTTAPLHVLQDTLHEVPPCQAGTMCLHPGTRVDSNCAVTTQAQALMRTKHGHSLMQWVLLQLIDGL
jgi:hypothetical protein